MPSAVSRALRIPVSAVRRLLRRHRRMAAAILAGLGALVALVALRTPAALPADVAFGGALPNSTMRAGEVLIPVAMASGAIASALEVGDVVDLIGLTGDDQVAAEVVTPRARVVELPIAGSALSGPSSGVVLVAVPASAALPLSAASANGGLTVVIRSR